MPWSPDVHLQRHWHAICSLVGSLNKIPLSIAGIVLFKVPTSLENSASIFFGKFSPANWNESSSHFWHIHPLSWKGHPETEATSYYRSLGRSVFCSSKNVGEILVVSCSPDFFPMSFIFSPTADHTQNSYSSGIYGWKEMDDSSSKILCFMLKFLGAGGGKTLLRSRAPAFRFSLRGRRYSSHQSLSFDLTLNSEIVLYCIIAIVPSTSLPLSLSLF